MNPRLSVPTYVILDEEKKTGCSTFILEEFSGRDEFILTIVNTIENEDTWGTIARIIRSLPEEPPEFILICEDNHQFTTDYSPTYLASYIKAAQQMEADILIGGPSSFDNAVRVGEHLYWVEGFDGFQFIIFFKRFFSPFLSSISPDGKDTSSMLSRPLGRKLFIHPYISTKRATEYADAVNSPSPGVLRRLFDNSSSKVNSINKITGYYRSLPVAGDELSSDDLDGVTIPTYVINLPERTERLEHIKKEFEGKGEFDVTIVDACKHTLGNVGLWHSIRKVLEIAIRNDEDVIIICEDDHQFTRYYSKEVLLRNIIEAHYQGAGLLIGGVGHFTQIIPLSPERLWIDFFWSTQFLVIFKKSFDRIMSSEFDDTVTADDFLSEIIDEKMVIFPFISIQKDFGYSDISDRSKRREVPDIFTRCANRLKQILNIHKEYGFTAEIPANR